MSAMSTTSTATVMFCDLVSSTERQTRLGDDAADVFRRRLFAAMRTAAEQSRGKVIKSLGDGVMVVFQASILDALKCAVDLHENCASIDLDDPPLLRIGLASGEIAEEDGDVFGLPVVEAARLCAAAQPGQTLATDVVRAMLGSRGRYQLSPRGELSLKGIPQPVRIVELLREGGPVPTPEPANSAPPPPVAPPSTGSLPPPTNAPAELAASTGSRPAGRRAGLIAAAVAIAAALGVGGWIAFGGQGDDDSTTASTGASAQPSSTAPSASTGDSLAANAADPESPDVNLETLMSPEEILALDVDVVLNDPSPVATTYSADDRIVVAEVTVPEGTSFNVYWNPSGDFNPRVRLRVVNESGDVAIVDGRGLVNTEAIVSDGGTYRILVGAGGTKPGTADLQALWVPDET